MDGDRKYKQRGYQDNAANSQSADPRARFQPPRHVMDVTAPRTPRMVQNVTASRCYSCATTLPAAFDFLQPCPKCGAELHCCKQCQNFEPSAHFQCVKPIEERIAYKDKRNECSLFVASVTVARESTPPPAHVLPKPPEPPPPPAPKVNAAAVASFTPRTPNDARAAFENLFKK